MRKIICLRLNIVPLKTDVVLRVAPVGPPTCQKIFEALAQPESSTSVADAIVKSPAI